MLRSRDESIVTLLQALPLPTGSPSTSPTRSPVSVNLRGRNAQGSASLQKSIPRGHATIRDSKKGRQTGGVSNGGVSRSGLVLPFLSFFVLLWDFPDFSGIFPTCSGMVRGFSRLVLFLFHGLLRAPTKNSPERVHDTIWTFPKEGGKHRGVWKPPGLASLNSKKGS